MVAALARVGLAFADGALVDGAFADGVLPAAALAARVVFFAGATDAASVAVGSAGAAADTPSVSDAFFTDRLRVGDGTGGGVVSAAASSGAGDVSAGLRRVTAPAGVDFRGERGA